MQYAICHLGTVPLRNAPSDTSEMVSQALYGEFFKILEERSRWSRVRTFPDACEAWISNQQFQKISEREYYRLEQEEMVQSADLVEFISTQDQALIPVPLGAVVNGVDILNHGHSGNSTNGRKEKENLVRTALLYLNAPFLWGGKTPFGIDSSGLTQMVYRLNGFHLNRNAAEQAQQGESLSFIEESQPGDLAFFDDQEGVITHVAIVLEDNYVIHADGKVRLDRIDHSGIYNVDLKRHTHKLRVIKKII